MSLFLSVLAIFIIVSLLGRSNLYCNSVAITKQTFHDSTTFCHIAGWTHSSLNSNRYSLMSILGAVFQYFALSATLWWFFHVCSIFYKIMFPLTAKQYKKKEKYFHIVLLFAGMFHCMRQSHEFNF